jgi:hypothetical protein
MIFLLILNILVGLSLFVHAICVINRMTRTTNHFLRLGYVVMAVGAMGVVAGPLYGYTSPRWTEVLLNLGVAIVLITAWQLPGRKLWLS